MFPTTRVSILERYRTGGGNGQQAVADWFTLYRSSMCQFVAWQFPQFAPRADDLVQEFIVQKVLPQERERSLLAQFVPQPGKRFRSYLSVSLKNFCLDMLKGQRETAFLLDESFDQPHMAHVDSFDIVWARQVVGRAIRRVRKACWSVPKLRGVWGILEARFLRPFRGKTPVEYADLVRRYGFRSSGEAQKAATLAKRMLRKALTSVVSDYTGSEAAELELMDLWRVMRRIRDHRSEQEPRPHRGELDKE